MGDERHHVADRRHVLERPMTASEFPGYEELELELEPS
jgi:hypothetical protein